ncbi:MAG: SH3 domain-containing protein, partial [Saprospiraceae bacterium]|nr:SH3 domain-containing protein [Saprospiraceae bacterium]
MKIKQISYMIGLGMLMLFLSACNGEGAAVVATIAPNLPSATVTAPDGINVRSGPGEEYAAVGTLAFGEQTLVVGRSADSAWWVIPTQGATNNQGWISATYVKAVNTENVPVIPPPASAPSTSAGSDITDIVWKWQKVEDVASDSSTRVDDPNKYTIVFYTDGTTTGQADCN